MKVNTGARPTPRDYAKEANPNAVQIRTRNERLGSRDPCIGADNLKPENSV